MTNATILTLILSLALTTTAFAATAEEQCQKTLSFAWGKYELCVQKETGKYYGGGDFEKTRIGMGKCVDKLAQTWPKVVTKYPGTTCSGDRYTDNGDLTFTDNLTRRVWEEKTDDGSIHDKDDLYTWSTGYPYKEDGTAFGTFLNGLNDASFGGSRGWRIPTLAEINSLVEPGYPNCTTAPCTTVPGETVSSFYWSSSTCSGNPDDAWDVHFNNGNVPGDFKSGVYYVRAVRGGS